jgi:PTH1 family peptidyl-tRNA hydrolase
MNLSGKAVLEICSFYKIKPSEVFVVHDELDFELGRIGVKLGGGDAGHNGLKSITSAIGSGYYRVRIGISRPKNSGEVSSFVLSDFLPEEISVIEGACKKISLNLDTLLIGDLNKFYMKITQK